jgi:hypothetical protein
MTTNRQMEGIVEIIRSIESRSEGVDFAPATFDFLFPLTQTTTENPYDTEFVRRYRDSFFSKVSPRLSKIGRESFVDADSTAHPGHWTRSGARGISAGQSASQYQRFPSTAGAKVPSPGSPYRMDQTPIWGGHCRTATGSRVRNGSGEVSTKHCDGTVREMSRFVVGEDTTAGHGCKQAGVVATRQRDRSRRRLSELVVPARSALAGAGDLGPM